MRSSYLPGLSPVSVADQWAMLNRIGHSFGLPAWVNPHTLLGRTSLGSSAPQSDGGGSSTTGFQTAAAHAGSVAASLPSVPAFGRNQHSIRSSPGQPTMAVPRIATGP